MCDKKWFAVDPFDDNASYKHGEKKRIQITILGLR